MIAIVSLFASEEMGLRKEPKFTGLVNDRAVATLINSSDSKTLAA